MKARSGFNRARFVTLILYHVFVSVLLTTLDELDRKVSRIVKWVYPQW